MAHGKGRLRGQRGLRERERRTEGKREEGRDLGREIDVQEGKDRGRVKGGWGEG